MKRKINAFVLLAVFGGLVFSCDIMNQSPDRTNQKTGSTDVRKSLSATAETSVQALLSDQLDNHRKVTLNGYDVEFIEYAPEVENDEVVSTTFHYKISGTGERPQLDSFFLEVPECAREDLASWSFVQSATRLDGGIRWNRSVSSTGFEEFSVTYNGEVHKGIIDVVVTRAGTSNTDQIIGPCKGVYELSGSIFIDANEDGVKQASESGIQRVEVLLADEDDEPIGSVSTSLDGKYVFKVLKGNYIVSVPENLFDGSYSLTTGKSVDVDVPNEFVDATKPNIVPGPDFGYKMETGQIIRYIENSKETGDLDTQPTKYWVQQIRHAGKRNSNYTETEMKKLLSAIEGFFLKVPFEFDEDDPLGDALDILTRPLRSDLDEFLQQLLTAELNVISKLEDVDYDVDQMKDFERALLVFGEARACEDIAGCQVEPLSSQSVLAPAAVSLSSMTLSDGTRVLSAFNGTGGIGSR